MNAYWVEGMRVLKLAGVLLASGLFATPGAFAEPSNVERFDAASWDRLQTDLSRPAAIVFTATYCVNCPAVLAQLAQALKAHGIKGEIVAVVIDDAAAPELLKSEHYAQASRLFLFEGNEASLRYRVDPRWRGVTPYIALLSDDGKTTFSAGTPSAEQVAAWLGKARAN